MMVGGGLSDPGPVFDCKSKMSHYDDTPITNICTIFLATMVDAKDFILHLETTFKDELWPAVRSELAKSRSKVTELQKDLADSLKERKVEKQSFTEAIQKIGVEREAERNRLLQEIDELQSLVEQERCRFQTELDLGMKSSRPFHDTVTDEEKLHKQNEEMQQRVDQLLEENCGLVASIVEHKEQIQRLTDEIEQLKEAARLATTKQIYLQAENKTLNKMRADYEKNFHKSSRMSLPGKHSERNIGSPLSAWTGHAHVKDGSFLDQLPSGKKQLGQLPQTSPSLSAHNNHKSPIAELAEEKSHPSGSTGTSRRTKPDIRRINIEADEAANRLPLLVSASIPHDAEVAKQVTCENSLKGKFNPFHVSDVISSQIPEADEFGSVVAPSQTKRDSDETVMDASLTIDGSKESKAFPVLRRQAPTDDLGTGKAGFQPAGARREVVCPINFTKGKQLSVEERVSPQHRPVAVPISSKMPSHSPSGTIRKEEGLKKSKERMWRQTRSRTEPCDGGDPHDSFLDTPREEALATLKAGKPTARNCSAGYTHHAQTPDNHAQSGGREPSAKAMEVPRGCKAGAEQASTVAVDAYKTGGSDKDKKINGSKVPTPKFNEPVRKKRDREALLATDCDQCKAFYEAVVSGNADGIVTNLCEHHDAVSRHRFNYLPPSTPSGFWNIGFESDM